MSADKSANRRFYTLPSLDHDTDIVTATNKATIHDDLSNVKDYGDLFSHAEIDFNDTKNSLESAENRNVNPNSNEKHFDSSHTNKLTTVDLLWYIQKNVIGVEKTFSGPFGLRSALYLDFVASGRALRFIEDYIGNEVLPEYGNTHTTTSITSLQTTLFRHEARDIVRNACNASEHDSVIFVGSGATGAINKLIHALHLHKSTIVFTGPYEHHSNILPWIEAGAKVVRISETDSGNVNIEELKECLKALKGFDGQLIGAFSAASNVTGILTNVDEITVLLHTYGALAFWDYAAAAPYVKIDMNPFIGGSSQHLVYKDAIYFSMHKFVGGIDCPGLLIAKKSLFRQSAPEEPGGGTVFFVRRESHRYLQEPEMREEGGTPAIVGSIRAGLIFQLKESVGTDLINNQDAEMLRKATTAWSKIPNLVVLGPSLGTTNRLPIFSFLVYHPLTGRFLHHNFVAAILNDVFGIQSRGGCACAGPYAMDLLGMRESVSEKFENLLAEDSNLDRTHLRRIGEYSHREFIRPGFVRINLPYFLDNDSVDFALEAISLVAEHAWKLLPQYLFNPETGEWRHRQFQTFKDRKWLGHISYASGKMCYHQPTQVVRGPLPTSHQECINSARDIFIQAEKFKIKLPDQTLLFDEDSKLLRWFVLPSEAHDCLNNKFSKEPVDPSQLPFCPPGLLLRLCPDVPPLASYSAIQKVKGLLLQWESHKEKAENISINKSFIQSNIETRAKQNIIPDTDMSDSTFHDTTRSSPSQVIPFHEGLTCSLEQGFVKAESQDGLCESQDPVIGAQSENQSGTQKSSPADTNSADVIKIIPLSDKGNIVDDPGIVEDEISNKVKTAMSICNGYPTVLDDTVSNVVGEDADTRQVKSQSSTLQVKNKRNSSKWFSPPKSIFKLTVTAIEEYSMLQDGDKVLICLSGGKDSLSLLHTIRQYKFYARGKGINFEFGAVTIDPETPSYDPSPLKEYLSSLNVPYFYESQCIMETANNLPYECASICSFCSRMKRGRIYAAARREGYNLLALGQHLDDLSESFMMSFLHNGTLNTMKAHYTVKEGDLRVIRPFIHVRETDLRSFAEKNKLPIIAENCPACFEAPKERHRVKQLLAAQEVMFPQVYNSMLSAMKPLMARKRQGGTDAPLSKTSTSPENELKPHSEDDFDMHSFQLRQYLGS